LKSLRALIIDDEPPARRKLALLMRDEADIEIIGQCSNGLEAITAIEEKHPDVIFLDIQMPGLNGFEMLEALGTDNLPFVVFVTAYDEFAVKAFEVHALDYLLKPFDRSRLQDCLARVRKAQRSNSSNLHELLEQFRPKEYLSRFVVKARGRVLLLKTDDVDSLEASGNYVELRCGKQTYLVRDTLNDVERRLDPQQFARVHRSTIVNLDRVQELQPWSHGDFVVILKDGTKLRLSRRYRQNLKAITRA
jgi:two-component system, LytTR family, response regulator